MRKPFAILFLSFIPLICTAASEPAHIPIAADAVPYSEPLQNIPAGAREFEVLPPAGGQTIVRGEDFGITGNCENFSQKLQAAIDSCKKLGASKLVLKKGIYRITENDTIKFEKLENFTFCGGGSTLVFRKKSGSLFDIRNCERVEFKNFNVDWDWDADPLGAVAKIVKIEQSAFLQNVDFKFVDYEGRTYPNRQCLLRNVARIDPSTRSAGVEGGQNFGWEMFGKPKYKKQWIDGNTIRITLPAKSRLNVGEFYRINHYYYDMPCFFMRSNRHIAMRDINIYSCAGMGIIVFGTQQYFSLQNFNFKIPDGEHWRRASTCTADHVHIAHSRGFVKIEDCLFEYGGDDCVNIQNKTCFGYREDSRTLLVKNCKRWWSEYEIGDEIELRESDYRPSGFTAKITRTETKSPTERRMYFEAPIPRPKGEGFVVFDKKYDSRNIIIRNCVFKNVKARGFIIQANDVTVENCRLEHVEQGSVKICTGYTHNAWSEGAGVDNVVIRNCIFDTCNPKGKDTKKLVRDIYTGVYLKVPNSDETTDYPILKNILFENNTFKNTFGLVAYITSARNVIFADNTIVNTTPRKTELPYRGGFYAANSSEIKIVNNRFAKSPCAASPEIIADIATLENCIFEGNKMVEFPETQTCQKTTYNKTAHGK